MINLSGGSADICLAVMNSEDIGMRAKQCCQGTLEFVFNKSSTMSLARRAALAASRTKPVFYTTARAASTSSNDHHDDHHHQEDTTVYPPEGPCLPP
jgi:hypothetical protein